MKRLIALPLAIIVIVTSMLFFAFADDPGDIMIRFYFSDDGAASSYYTATLSNGCLSYVPHKNWYVDRFILNRSGAVGWTRYSFRIGGLLDLNDTAVCSMPSFGSNLQTLSYTISISGFNLNNARIYCQNSGSTEIEDMGRTPVYRSAQFCIDILWPDDTSYNYATITLSSPVHFTAIDSSNTYHKFIPTVDNCSYNHNPDPILLAQYNLLSNISNYQDILWNVNNPGVNYIDRFHQFLDFSVGDYTYANYKPYWPSSTSGLPVEQSAMTWRNFEYWVQKLLSKKLSYDVGQIEAANNQGALDAVSEAQEELPNALDILAGQTAGASNATVYSNNVWSAVGDLFGWWSQDNLNNLNTIPNSFRTIEEYPYLDANIDAMNNILYGGDD